MIGVLMLLLLTQAPPGDPPPEGAPPAAQSPAGAEAPPAPAVEVRPPPNQKAEEVRKMVDKLATMTPKERVEMLQDLNRKYGTVDFNPVLPPSDVDLEKYNTLSENDQVMVTARRFFLDLIAGDVAQIVSRTGLPFTLEDRRIERLEDLRAEWAKNLRRKRTDLLTLYDVEVLQPPAMEKKYGKPPARLRNWSPGAGKTCYAVGNLSGHPVVVLLRQVGIAWQVVGYHD